MGILTASGGTFGSETVASLFKIRRLLVMLAGLSECRTPREKAELVVNRREVSQSVLRAQRSASK